MKRLTLVVSSTVVSVAILAVVYVTGPYRSPDAVKYPVGEALQAHQSETVNTEANASTAVDAQSLGHDSEQGKGEEARRIKTLADEAATREWVTEETTRDIREDYSLLIEQLDLTPGEIEALLEFLIEDAIARTKTSYSDGVGMDEHERSARIEEILGDAKLQQFLAFERNLVEFRELQFVQNMLKQKEVSLTEAQSDGLLKIMIDVREQVGTTRPQHIEPGSIEAVEHTLSQLDEYDRLVTEVAPSVLSAKQVEYMFERNLEYSYRRSMTLEWHKQRRADNPDDEIALGYFPKKD